MNSAKRRFGNMDAQVGYDNKNLIGRSFMVQFELFSDENGAFGTRIICP